MATNFPSSLDNFTNPVSGNTLDSPSHSLQHSDANDAIEAIEAKLGVGASPAGSATAGDVLTISSAGTSAWTTAGQAFKNLIINGDMQVAQRGTSVTGITSGQYTTADRWLFNISSLGTWTSTVENDAPTGSGFRKSFKMLCTTADASPAGTDYAAILQKIEGQNLQQIAKGTSSAKQLSLSFWVKSNVTGTYSVMIYDQDNTRFTSFTYAISASATWEKKTISIPADTTGVFDNDNNDSLQIYFNLGSGSSYTGGAAQSTWASFTGSETKWMPSQTNVAAAINNYFQITGVQLEVGSIATGFEFLPIDIELERCQRYYQKSYALTEIPGNGNSGEPIYIQGANYSGTAGYLSQFPFKVRMRAAPTITFYRPSGLGSGNGVWVSFQGSWQNMTVTGNASETGLNVSVVTSHSNTAGYAGQGHYAASSEL